MPLSPEAVSRKKDLTDWLQTKNRQYDKPTQLEALCDELFIEIEKLAKDEHTSAAVREVFQELIENLPLLALGKLKYKKAKDALDAIVDRYYTRNLKAMGWITIQDDAEFKTFEADIRQRIEATNPAKAATTTPPPGPPPGPPPPGPTPTSPDFGPAEQAELDRLKTEAENFLTEVENAVTDITIASLSVPPLDRVGPYTSTALGNAANVYAFIANNILGLENNPNYRDLRNAADARRGKLVDPVRPVWQAIEQRAQAVLDEVKVGVGGNPSLVTVLFESDSRVTDLISAAGVLSGAALNGSTSHVADLANLEAARTALTGANMPGPFAEKKREQLDPVAALIEKTQFSNWLYEVRNVRPEFARIRATLAQTAANLIAPPLVPDAVLKRLRKELADAQAVYPDAGSDPKKSTVLQTEYFGPMERKIKEVEDLIGERKTQAEAAKNKDEDPMLMDLEKLLDLLAEKQVKLEAYAESNSWRDSTADIYEAYAKRMRSVTLENIDFSVLHSTDPARQDERKKAEEDLRAVFCKVRAILNRLDDKANPSPKPEGNRSDLMTDSKYLDSLLLTRHEFLYVTLGNPVYGKFMKELLMLVENQAAVTKGWMLVRDFQGKIRRVADTEALGRPPVLPLLGGQPTTLVCRHNPELTYDTLTSGTGKTVLKAQLKRLFNELINDPRFAGDRGEILRNEEVIRTMSKNIFLGFSLLDDVLALIQEQGGKTRNHEQGAAKEMTAATNPFRKLIHILFRYNQATESTAAWNLPFWPALPQHQGYGSHIQIERVHKHRELVSKFFKIFGISMKGVEPEQDKGFKFADPTDGSVRDPKVRYVNPIKLPEWGASSEAFPFMLERLCPNNGQMFKEVWDAQGSNIDFRQMFAAEQMWLEFENATMADIPFGKSKEDILGMLKHAAEITLGQAKLFEGNHWKLVPPKLTLYIRRLVMSYKNKDATARGELLETIINRLKGMIETEKNGLWPMRAEISKVIANLEGDHQFYGFDSSFKPLTPTEERENALDYFLEKEEFDKEVRAHEHKPSELDAKGPPPLIMHYDEAGAAFAMAENMTSKVKSALTGTHSTKAPVIDPVLAMFLKGHRRIDAKGRDHGSSIGYVIVDPRAKLVPFKYTKADLHRYQEMADEINGLHIEMPGGRAKKVQDEKDNHGK